MIYMSRGTARMNQQVTVAVLSDAEAQVELTLVTCICTIDQVLAGQLVALRPRPRTYGPINATITHNVVGIVTADDGPGEDKPTPRKSKKVDEDA